MNSEDKYLALRTQLYTYWHELPFHKNVDSASYFLLEKSELENFILKYIQDGVEDDFGKKHGLLRRHAFSAKELKLAYDDLSFGQKYSISNFHFHINKMVEDGYLKEVVRILDSRHYVSYYGKTAVSFVTEVDDNMSTFLEEHIYGPLWRMVKETRKDVSKEYFDTLVEKNKRLYEDYYSGVEKFEKEMYPHFYNAKMDFAIFGRFISHFTIFNEELTENLREIGRLVGLDNYLGSNGTVSG